MSNQGFGAETQSTGTVIAVATLLSSSLLSESCSQHQVSWATLLLHLVTPGRPSFTAQKMDPDPVGDVACILPRAVGSFFPPYSLVAVGSGGQNKVE